MGLNPLPKDKIFDWSKLKAFADYKINVEEKLKFVFGKGRKHCGKQCFQKVSAPPRWLSGEHVRLMTWWF